jgi:hypothetical protein
MDTTAMTGSPHSRADLTPELARDVEVQTALALSRAASRAMIAISPKAHRAMMDALGVEAAMQEAQGGAVAALVAARVRDHLDTLK